jgi:hypothetical protein
MANTYTSGLIAQELGKSADWFYAHKAELIEKHGMPAPLPGPGHPRWSRAQIDAWLIGYKKPEAANDPVPMPHTAHDLDQARALLHQAYGRARIARRA